MIDGPAVTFVHHDPQARRVAVAGEFNQWNRTGELAVMEQIDSSGIFHYTLTLTEPARLEYKFLVDDEWKLDPLCPNLIDNAVGDQNSYFVVGDFHEPPELEAVESIAHGNVEEFEFASERLGNRRAVALCRHIGATPQLSRYWLACAFSTQFRESYGPAARSESSFCDWPSTEDLGLTVEAHYGLGSASFFYLGDYVSALAHFEDGIALYDSLRQRRFLTAIGMEAGVASRCMAAWSLWPPGLSGQGAREDG
jgi:Glycogen recognition site of AMP-activated protein kinase